ncbi:MAG: hypothetical protein JWR80_6706 [Bradyrhizobium sp.]|nr:hypothetical protein [Bradyrhizobium sp.]
MTAASLQRQSEADIGTHQVTAQSRPTPLTGNDAAPQASVPAATITAFAFPDEPMTSAVFQALAGQEARQRLCAALDQVVRAGWLAQTDGAPLREWIANAAFDVRFAWHGAAAQLDPPTLDVRSAIAVDHLMLTLAVLGCDLDHRFRSKGVRLFAAPDLVVDTGTVRSIRCMGGQLCLADATGRLRDTSVASPGLRRLPGVASRSGIIAVVSRDVVPLLAGGPLVHPTLAPDALPLVALQGAMRRIDDQAPAYARWCGDTITALIPVLAPPGMIASGSQADRPGLVHLSADAPDLWLGEMLIHEASHQYFELLARHIDLVAPGSKETVYSPVKRRPRPLDRALLTYHAFANVARYMRTIKPGGTEEAEAIAGNLVATGDDLEQLAGQIDAAATLTEAGRAFWRRLREDRT